MLQLVRQFCRHAELKPSSPATGAVSVNKALVDRFSRPHTYLRISLTERCNLRCKYCMPEDGVPLTPPQRILTSDEIIRLSSFFVNLGVNKIRLTGGEPLLRRELVGIVRGLNELRPLGLTRISMTTNGITLKRNIDELQRAGIDEFNISLDTLNEAKFEFIARRRGFKQTMSSVDAAVKSGLVVKINCVAMRNVNDDEIVDFVRLTMNKDIDVRFIEFMPFQGNKWNEKKFVPFSWMLNEIEKTWPMSIVKLDDDFNSTSKGYRIEGAIGRFGFITSMSQNFCGACNRIRITADGNLKVCLFGNAEVSLRDALRSGKTDSQMLEMVATAISGKKKQHADMSNLSSMDNRPMILIGG